MRPDPLVADFVAESREDLDRLQLDPGSPDAMAAAFRTLHTLKGTSAALGLPAVEAAAHQAEDQLAALLADPGDRSARARLLVTVEEVWLLFDELDPALVADRGLETTTRRLVDDLAARLGKKVDLHVSGPALDRRELDGVRDAVTHLVRNALDHGIESPDVRRAAGKPERGALTVSAYDAAHRLVLEVSDDGAGIDPAWVRARAVAGGHVDRDHAHGLDDDAVLDLLFVPGFSTADEVTAVSGRGVGMDVVRADVLAVGGTVEVVSVPGRGTTVRLSVPSRG